METAAQLQPQPVSHRCALVVDADPQVTAALCNVFNTKGWDIVHAADNSSALRFVEASPFDLVVTGKVTTGRQDIELLREIRRVRPHVRLIILTDENTPADVIAAIRERAFSYFSRPFTTDSLEEMVRSATATPVWDDGIELVSATPQWISIAARCDLTTADRLVQFFQEMSDLPHPEREDVATAFREMLLNAMEYGGNFDPTQYVEVSYVRTNRSIMCRIKDPGQGFSLDEILHVAVNNPSHDPIRHTLFREAQGMRPGGYGVLLTRHLVDDLLYSQKGNEVLLVKYLASPEGANPSLLP
jgi:DNA-binding NarL/FixJ family response regulator